MEKEHQSCTVMGYFWKRKVHILGLVLIILASAASLLSFSGLGLLGMLLVGFGLMAHHCMSKRHCKCCCCHDDSCHQDTCCDMQGDVCEVKPVKKSKAKTKA